MKKEELTVECNNLLEKINDSSELVHGAGEFLEKTVGDLVPYLNKDGLIFLRSQLLTLLTN